VFTTLQTIVSFPIISFPFWGDDVTLISSCSVCISQLVHFARIFFHVFTPMIHLSLVI